MRARRSLVVTIAACLGVPGCVEPGPEGTSGVRNKVVFQAPTELVFSSRVAVGSTFAVTALAKTDETVISDSATVVPTNEEALAVSDVEVAGGEVRCVVSVTAPGAAALAIVDDGVELDRIALQAARAVQTTLVDATLLDSGAAVDPTLPARFAIADDGATRVLVSATDKCGEAVLDLGASEVVVVAREAVDDSADDVDPASLAVVTADGPAAFTIAPTGAHDFALELRTPGLQSLAWQVSAVRRGDVDEVAATAASADPDTSSVTLWGRAFVNDVEFVGGEFTWTADERVTLSTASGATTAATIAFPAPGEPADERPATVTAEVVGESAVIDLLALTSTDLVTSRDAPPLRESSSPETTDAGFSCGGTPCDALAAFVPMVGLRLRRRRRA